MKNEKPRITKSLHNLRAKYYCTGAVSSGLIFVGAGPTPRIAYEAWELQAAEHSSKIAVKRLFCEIFGVCL